MEQKIGFCDASDGVRIAYATAGDGPPLVKAPNWLNHLGFEWGSPIWSHWWTELSKHHLLVRFDQRGCGLSTWLVDDLSFDAWVRDLEAVVDDLGLREFALLGISQGGAVAIEYAARHPERVSHLVLHGAFARGRAKRGVSQDELEAEVTLTRRGWARNNPAYRQIFTSQFMPDATAEQMRWFNELQRVSTSAENAAKIQAESYQIDVLDRLPLVSAPTLVMHCRDDQRIPFDQGRQLAALIPHARLVALDSQNHLLIEEEPAWRAAVSEVRRFLGAAAPEAVSSPPAAAIPQSPETLTSREIEVLRLIALGRTNREIAEELVISYNTAINHVKRILSKTGSANRVEAAAYAISHGLGARGEAGTRRE